MANNSEFGPQSNEAASTRNTFVFVVLAGLLLMAVWALAKSDVTIVQSFPSPGSKPEGIAWDGAFLWSNDFDDGTLSKIDPHTGTVVASYRGGGLPNKPEGLAWDGEHLWTCDWDSGVISKIRVDENGIDIVQQFNKPENSGPNVGLGWDGTHLWLTCWPRPPMFEKGQLYKLDPTTLAVLQTHELPVWWIEDLAWDGEYMWSADWLFSIGFAINTATGDTLHTYASPGPQPVGTAWDEEYLWLTDTSQDRIYQLDISALRTVGVERSSWSSLKKLFR